MQFNQIPTTSYVNATLKRWGHDFLRINWDVIQVEPEGEFQIEPMRILDKKVTMLQNRAVEQVKVLSKQYGPAKATWELEDSMRLTHPFLFNFVEH